VPAREGWILAVVMTGVLMTAVDTTIVLMALPGIEHDLRALAFQVFVDSQPMDGRLAAASTTGLRTSFYVLAALMALAAASAARSVGDTGRET
jgi:hypothetical protein